MEENEIELHPEEVKQRQDAYSSLTDLNGIDVFSTEFQNTVKKVIQGKDQKEKEKKEEIFVNKIMVQQDYDIQLSTQLFLNEEELVLSHNYSENNAEWSLMDISLVLIAVLAVSALYMFFFQDRKVKK
ncbi:MAG: hypothetical protein MR992_09460 [Lachnospiraceae bacterium]|nr:hypothetical protein [Lachnospiraceae bacterium]MDD7627465.1 hypothetical protein [Lachnospiraceae bacterium]MDY4119577.1 hypothetical protein [Lachnospiraceae bacterium]